MAKIRMFGEAIVVNSSIKMDDLKLVEKYRPSALAIVEKDEDGSKREVFRVCTGNSGGICANGAIFTAADRETGEAQFTVTAKIDGTAEEITELISDKMGAGLMQLGKLEESLPAIVEEIKDEKAKIAAAIEIG